MVLAEPNLQESVCARVPWELDSGRDKTFGLYTVIARSQISENSSSRKIERFDQEFSCRLDRVILPSNLPNRIFDQNLN